MPLRPSKKKTSAVIAARHRPKRRTKEGNNNTPEASSTSASSVETFSNDDVSEIASEHRRFWDRLPDHAFFGPDVTHIYFYSYVDEDSVTNLRQQILEAARGTQTNPHGERREVRVTAKPIVIHVHSPGGLVWAGNWLYSLFNQVHVPICTLIDSESASAATFLTVGSPYRVGTHHSKSMLHDYSGAMMGKREEMLASHAMMETRTQQMKRMYLTRTRFNASELDDIMRRDIWLEAPLCKKKGILDRVIQPDRSEVARKVLLGMQRRMGGAAPFFKTNWNVLYSTCTTQLPSELDDLLAEKQSTKPVVYTAPGMMSCDDPYIMFACIPRIQSFEVPVFGVIDNDLTWYEVLPIQYCHRRFMYDNAQIVSNLAYVEAYGRVQDVVHNTSVDRHMITHVLKQRARPTEAFLRDIFDRSRYITAEECLKMGLVDEIIQTGVGGITSSSAKKGDVPAPPLHRRRAFPSSVAEDAEASTSVQRTRRLR